MKKLLVIIAILGTGTVYSQEMKVHKTDGTFESFLLSQIDSITFNVTNIIVPQGLVAYYPFNGNANDISGNGHNGFIRGAILTQDRFGNANSAYSFNGNNSYVAVPNDPTLNLTGDMSLCCWFSANSPLPTTNNDYSLVAKRYCYFGTIPSLYTPYDLAVNYTLPNDYNKIMFVSSKGADSGFVYSQMTNPVTNDEWNYIVVSIHNDSINFYYNGSYSQTIMNGTTHRGANNDSLLIGGIAREFGAEYMRGYLDDIRIYNRPLNSSEISLLFLEGGGAQ